MAYVSPAIVVPIVPNFNPYFYFIVMLVSFVCFYAFLKLKGSISEPCYRTERIYKRGL